MMLRCGSLFALVLFLLASGVQGQTINSCVGVSGALRIINTGESCKANETPLSWNAAGPQGLPGLQGPPGVQGPQGATGPAGAAAAVACGPADPVVVGDAEFFSSSTSHGVHPIYGLTVGFDNPGSVSSGGGGGAGVVRFDKITLERPLASDSAELASRVFNGQLFTRAVITLRQPNGVAIASYELGTVLIADYGAKPSPDRTELVEEISIDFRRIALTYGAVTECWDRVTNTATCP